MEDYLLFKELYKNDGVILKNKLISTWIEDLTGIIAEYPKGYPTNISMLL